MKWTNKMYLAYYGMTRKQLIMALYLEIYGIELSTDLLDRNI